MADLSFSPIAKAVAGAPKWGTVAAFPSSGGASGGSTGATSRGGGTTAAELRQLLSQGGASTPTPGLGSAWNPTSPTTNSSSSGSSFWTSAATASGGDSKITMPSDDGRSSLNWRSPTSSSSSSQLYNANSSLSLAQAQALTADAVTVRRNHTISSAGGRIAAKHEQKQREASLQRLNSHFEQPGNSAVEQDRDMQQQQQQQSEMEGPPGNGSGEADGLQDGETEELALYGKASVQRNKSMPNSRSLGSSKPKFASLRYQPLPDMPTSVLGANGDEESSASLEYRYALGDDGEAGESQRQRRRSASGINSDGIFGVDLHSGSPHQRQPSQPFAAVGGPTSPIAPLTSSGNSSTQQLSSPTGSLSGRSLTAQQRARSPWDSPVAEFFANGPASRSPYASGSGNLSPAAGSQAELLPISKLDNGPFGTRSGSPGLGGANVRRHQSLSYMHGKGAGRNNAQAAYPSLVSRWGGAQDEQGSFPARGPPARSSTLDVAPPDGLEQYERQRLALANADGYPERYSPNSIAGVANQLANLDILSSSPPHSRSSAGLNSRHDRSSSQLSESSGLSDAAASGPRVASQLRKLPSLITDPEALAARAGSTSSRPPAGPASASAYVPPIGHGHTRVESGSSPVFYAPRSERERATIGDAQAAPRNALLTGAHSRASRARWTALGQNKASGPYTSVGGPGDKHFSWSPVQPSAAPGDGGEYLRSPISATSKGAAEDGGNNDRTPTGSVPPFPSAEANMHQQVASIDDNLTLGQQTPQPGTPGMPAAYVQSLMQAGGFAPQSDFARPQSAPFLPFQGNGGAIDPRADAAAAAMAAGGVNIPPEFAMEVHQLILQRNFNPPNFPYMNQPPGTRYFVIKSFTEDDVQKSLKHEIWASTEKGNARLDRAFRETKGLRPGNDDQGNGNGPPIYLFYSVNASGHFCGMAEMISTLDYNTTSNVWAQDNKWKGIFKVRWIYVKDLPNNQLRHLRLINTPEQKPVTQSRDTQELPSHVGAEMMAILAQYQNKTSLLQDWAYYEMQSVQQEALKNGPLNESTTPSQAPRTLAPSPAPSNANLPPVSSGPPPNVLPHLFHPPSGSPMMHHHQLYPFFQPSSASMGPPPPGAPGMQSFPQHFAHPQLFQPGMNSPFLHEKHLGSPRLGSIPASLPPHGPGYPHS